MKLLSKSDITQKKNDERRLEIDQGVKLASRVDSLRKTAAEEEKKITTYRQASVKILNDEIGSLTNQKRALEGEILYRVEELGVLMEPIDAQWDAVHRAHLLVEEDREALIEAKIGLKLGTDALEELKRRTTIDAERANDDRKAARLILEDATRVREDVARLQEKHLATVSLSEGQFSKRDSEVSLREGALSNREQIAAVWESNLKKREEAVSNKEIRVQDMYTTLLRTKSRN